MILEKNNVDDNIVECYYDSSNILKSIYFKEKQKLYIYFARGILYSYRPIILSLYEEFEQAESQGKKFLEKIKHDKSILFTREINLFDYEIKIINDKIKEVKTSFKNGN